MNDQSKPKKLTMQDVKTKPLPKPTYEYPEGQRSSFYDDLSDEDREFASWSESDFLGYQPGDQ